MLQVWRGQSRSCSPSTSCSSWKATARTPSSLVSSHRPSPPSCPPPPAWTPSGMSNRTNVSPAIYWSCSTLPPPIHLSIFLFQFDWQELLERKKRNRDVVWGYNAMLARSDCGSFLYPTAPRYQLQPCSGNSLPTSPWVCVGPTLVITRHGRERDNGISFLREATRHWCDYYLGRAAMSRQELIIWLKSNPSELNWTDPSPYFRCGR